MTSAGYSPDTWVLSDQNTWRRIFDLVPGDFVKSFKDGDVVNNRVENVWEKKYTGNLVFLTEPRKEMIYVTMSATQRAFWMTLDHRSTNHPKVGMAESLLFEKGKKFFTSAFQEKPLIEVWANKRYVTDFTLYSVCTEFGNMVIKQDGPALVVSDS